MKTVGTILIALLFPVFVIAQNQVETIISYNTTPLKQKFLAEAYFDCPLGDASVDIFATYKDQEIVSLIIKDTKDDSLVGIFELKNLKDIRSKNKIILMNIHPIKLGLINKLMQIYIDPDFSPVTGGKIYIDLGDGDNFVWNLYKPEHALVDEFKIYKREKRDGETDRSYLEAKVSTIEVKLNIFLSIRDKNVK